MPGIRLVNDKEVLALWRQGISAADIAARLEVTFSSIHRAIRRLREMGYKLPRRAAGRPPGPKDPAMEKRDKAIKAMCTKVGSYATAQHFGITSARVRQIAGPTGRNAGHPFTKKAKAS